MDPATVELDLGLTGAPRPHAVSSSDLATGLAGHRFTPTAQSREQVLELGEFDLRLALPALRVLAEDIEDHRGAVDDLHLDDVLEGAPLARGEFSVDDHGVRTCSRDDPAELLGLALAEVGARIGVSAALEQAVEDDGSRGLGEGEEFTHRVLGLDNTALPVDADEHHALDAELPILDLGDVFELGRETGDATKCLPVFAILLVPVSVIVLSVGQHRLGRECLSTLGPEDGVSGRLRCRTRQHARDDVVVVVPLGGICFSHWVNPSLSSFGRFL